MSQSSRRGILLLCGVFGWWGALAAQPYPPSPVFEGITWAAAPTVIRLAHGSDNWPITWGDDDALYTAYGDGWGFDPQVPNKLSLGLAKVTGQPPQIKGTNIRSSTAEQVGQGEVGKKASGMLMVDGTLYMWVRNIDGHGKRSQLAWSTDHAKTWTWSPWQFAEFGHPMFLNFRRDNDGARDGYSYIYSHDHPSAYDAANRMVLMRVPTRDLKTRAAYEFFTGLDAQGQPGWSSSLAQRGAVFTYPARCHRSSMSYHAPSGRYLWWQGIPGPDRRFRGGFGVYDAPEPWGPWTTVYFTEQWDMGPGDIGSFPTKWMDGDQLWYTFSGEDAFSVRQATLQRRVPDTLPPTSPTALRVP